MYSVVVKRSRNATSWPLAGCYGSILSSGSAGLATLAFPNKLNKRSVAKPVWQQRAQTAKCNDTSGNQIASSFENSVSGDRSRCEKQVGVVADLLDKGYQTKNRNNEAPTNSPM